MTKSYMIAVYNACILLLCKQEFSTEVAKKLIGSPQFRRLREKHNNERKFECEDITLLLLQRAHREYHFGRGSRMLRKLRTKSFKDLKNYRAETLACRVMLCFEHMCDQPDGRNVYDLIMNKREPLPQEVGPLMNVVLE